MKKKKKLGGTHEWATKSVNFSTGCENDCRYCYGRDMAVRFKQVDYDDWKTPRIRQKDVEKKHPNYGERVMFPSSHDLTPKNLPETRVVVGKLLEAKNKLLVVSKPRIEVIRTLCNTFRGSRDSILYRFTIGAIDAGILKFWEPGAPSYEERKEALCYAVEAGFETSVSVEPMLDAEHIDDLVGDLSPFITHSLWIGKMNYLHRIRIDGPEVVAEIERIKSGQADANIKAIYARHKDNPLIRWKGSIKDIVGIPRADKPGMDI